MKLLKIKTLAILIGLLMVLQPTSSLWAQETENLKVQFFDQSDRPWGGQEMVRGIFVRSEGCAMTSSAMVINYYLNFQGKKTNPLEMNNWLKKNGGYDTGGNIYWQKVVEYAQKNFHFPLKLKIIERKPTNEELKKWIKSGYPVIVKVIGPRRNHWVVVKGFKGNTFYINDPSNSATKKTTLNQYSSGALKARLYIPKGDLVLPKPPQKFVLKNKTAALVIDDSGSMSTNDPNFWRKKAAWLFLDKLEEGDLLIVNKFADSPQKIAQEKTSRPTNQKIKKVIEDNLSSNGMTDIEGALNQAFSQFVEDKNQEKFVILLTDGRQTVGDGKVNPESYLQFKKKGWKIHIIALLPEDYEEKAKDPYWTFYGSYSGDFPDVPLLKEIANQTKGQYIQTKNDQELINIYNRLLGTIQKRTALLDKSFVLKPKEVKVERINVPQYTAELITTTIWYGSRIDTHLISPNNQEVLPERVKEENYEVLRIKGPQPGIWKLKAEAVEVPPEGELVVLMAETKIDKNPPYIAFKAPLDYFQKTPLTISFKIQDENPLKKIKVTTNKKEVFNFKGESKTEDYNFNVGGNTGPLDVKIEAEDLASNKSAFLYQFFVDNNPPQIRKVSFQHPKIWQIRIKPKISFQAEEKESRIKNLKVVIKRKNKVVLEKEFSLPEKEKFALALDSSKTIAGRHTIIIEAEDSLDNSEKREKRIFIYTLPSIWNWIKSLF